MCGQNVNTMMVNLKKYRDNVKDTIRRRYAKLEMIQNKLLELDDLLIYSNKYKMLHASVLGGDFKGEDVEFVLHNESLGKCISIRTGITDIEEKDLTDKFFIETSDKRDVCANIMQLPKYIDKIESDKINTITLFYSGIFILCTIVHKK